MDVAAILRSINPFDLLVLLILAALFILGYIQGTIRRLLGIASLLFSFLLAANLRGPLGDFLVANWTQFPAEYSRMVGFGTLFVAASLALSLVIQAFYQRVPLFDKYTVVDEILGGLLGIVQGVILLGAMIIILDSYFQIPGLAARSGELPFLRELFNAYDGSITASIFRTTLIPAFFAVFGLFIPNDLRSLFTGSD